MFLEHPIFPTDISFRSRYGGPLYDITTVIVESGFEQANLNQDEPRHMWDVSYGIKNAFQLYDLLAFFHAVQASIHRFRFKDWSDFKTSTPGNRLGSISATDQPMVAVTGDTVFQLVKQYTRGPLTTTRTIQKPYGQILVALDGVEQPTGWTLDETTGLITFSVGIGAQVPTWGGEFHVPCKFQSERLTTVWEAWEIGRQECIVEEVRLIPS